MFVSGTTIYQFKAKASERKKISLVFMKYFRRFFSQWHGEKTGLNGCVHDFFVDYNTFDISVITDIHKYLMKKHDINNVWVN